MTYFWARVYPVFLLWPYSSPYGPIVVFGLHGPCGPLGRERQTGHASRILYTFRKIFFHLNFQCLRLVQVISTVRSFLLGCLDFFSRSTHFPVPLRSDLTLCLRAFESHRRVPWRRFARRAALLDPGRGARQDSGISDYLKRWSMGTPIPGGTPLCLPRGRIQGSLHLLCHGRRLGFTCGGGGIDAVFQIGIFRASLPLPLPLMLQFV